MNKLKNYLVGSNNPYLFNELNNGKIIMISGAWGAGKTYFWRNMVEPEIKKKFNSNSKDKAYVYLSLYGKNSLNDIKNEIYMSAYGDELISQEVTTFGIEALSALKDSEFAIGKLIKAFYNAKKSTNKKKGIEKLKDGGIICFDDFERKSKNVDLNDLFGFITRLADEYKCKIVIILNSEFFNENNARIFKNLKEKTISKFFYYQPTVDELFESIYDEERYGQLNNYSRNIKNIIKQTREINARVYIQALDNCLEWYDKKGDLDQNILRVIILGTFNFVLNHIIFGSNEARIKSESEYKYRYKAIKFDNKDINEFFRVQNESMTFNGKFIKNLTEDEIIDYLMENNNIKNEDIKKDEKSIRELWKYGYRLYYVNIPTRESYEEIIEFIKTGYLS